MADNWRDQYETHLLKAFTSPQDAQRYIKFQGWTTRQAQVRRWKDPAHKLANRVGNIIVVRKGEGLCGPLYVFENGTFDNGFQHGTALFDRPSRAG